VKVQIRFSIGFDGFWSSGTLGLPGTCKKEMGFFSQSSHQLKHSLTCYFVVLRCA
jgi:hypothetical protein